MSTVKGDNTTSISPALVTNRLKTIHGDDGHIMSTSDNANKLPNFGQVDSEGEIQTQHEGMAGHRPQLPWFPPTHQHGALLRHHRHELLPAGAQGHVMSPSATSNTPCVVYQDLYSEINLMSLRPLSMSHHAPRKPPPLSRGT